MKVSRGGNWFIPDIILIFKASIYMQCIFFIKFITFNILEAKLSIQQIRYMKVNKIFVYCNLQEIFYPANFHDSISLGDIYRQIN